MIRNLYESDSILVNEFLTANNGHILQSFQWGKLREIEGHKIVRLGFFDDKAPPRLKAYCQIVFHKLPKWYPSKNKYIGEVWRGPVLTEDLTKDEFNSFTNAFIKVGKENDAVFIKFEPKIIRGSKFEDWFKQSAKQAEETFIPCTAILNLEQSEEELMASFDKYTRKNINKAIRKGVVVKIILDKDEQKEAIGKTYKLMQTTSARAGFRIRREKFYKDLIDIQDNQIKVHILEANTNRGLAASYIAMTMDDTIYTPYSGSSREFSDYKANDLINWELIKYAKSLGIKKYDQWGVLTEDAPLNDPMWGVTKFKLGFNGKRESYIGAYDLVISPGDYKLFSFSWNMRKLYKKIRKN